MTMARPRELAPLIQKAGLAISQDLRFRRPGQLLRAHAPEARIEAEARHLQLRPEKAARE